MFVRVACVALLALVTAAESCENCEADEIHFLQAKSEEDPKDSKLVATEGKGKKGPDFSKIVDAAREAVKAGMTKVTSQMNEIVVQMNEFATDAEVAFNESFDDYKRLASKAANATQNLTKFKALVEGTIAEYVPFYSGAVEQVNAAVKAAQMVVKTMGKKELEEKLQDVNATVTTKLNALAKTASEFSSAAAKATLKEYKKVWKGLKDKLAYISETTGSFRVAFKEKLQTFTGMLEEPLKVALGDDATKQINDLTSSTSKMLANLQHLTDVYRAGLAEAADDVDTAMTHAASHRSWLRRIFDGLFH